MAQFLTSVIAYNCRTLSTKLFMFQLYLNCRSASLGVRISRVSEGVLDSSSSSQLSSFLLSLDRTLLVFLTGDFFILLGEVCLVGFLQAVRVFTTVESVVMVGVVVVVVASRPFELWSALCSLTD